MKKILVIGGGAMGSAFTIPCIDNKNKVIITEPYSNTFIKDLSSKQKYHSALKIKLPKKLEFKKFSKNLFKEKYDLIVISVCHKNFSDLGGKKIREWCKTNGVIMDLKNTLPSNQVDYTL